MATKKRPQGLSTHHLTGAKIVVKLVTAKIFADFSPCGGFSLLRDARFFGLLRLQLKVPGQKPIYVPETFYLFLVCGWPQPQTRSAG